MTPRNLTFPFPIILDNQTIGRVLAQGAADRILLVELDQRLLVRTPPSENPNHMDDDAFQGLISSIEKGDYSQTGAIFVPGNRCTIEDKALRLEKAPHIIDGNHRKSAADLLGLDKTPWSFYLTLREGEEKLLRILLNKHRGNIIPKIESEQLASLLASGWEVQELMITGYSLGELEAMRPMEAPTIDLPDVVITQLNQENEAPKKEAAGVLALEFLDAEDFKTASEALNRYAKAAKARGSKPIKLGQGLLRLLKTVEGE